MDERKEIDLPEPVSNRLIDLYRIVATTNDKINGICASIIEFSGSKGPYSISQDFKKLVPVEEQEKLA